LTKQQAVLAIDSKAELHKPAKALAQRMPEAASAPVPQPEGDTLIAALERAARDPTVDVVKMKELLAMRREITAQRSEEAFNAAMSAAQAELTPVIKNRANTQTHSKYADLAAIAEQAMPIIHKHGFGLIFSEFESKRQDCLGVACKVTHAAGHSERHEFNVPLDGAGMKGTANKTATHAYGSSFSYGRRYATCGVFNIATKDDDGNAAGKASAAPVEMVTEEQAAALKTLMEKAGVEEQIIFDHFKVSALIDLSAAQHKTAVNKCNAKIRAGT
jgi:hypothetical protein